MNSRKDKYDISGKVHISVGEEKIHQMMQDYDGVIIWDLHSTAVSYTHLRLRWYMRPILRL